MPNPWEQTQNDFMAQQYTGHIQSDAYKQYGTSEGIWFIKKEKYPILVDTLNIDNQQVEVRQDDEHLKYTKWGPRRFKFGDDEWDGEDIMRDEKGLALYLTDDEAAAKGYPIKSANLAAFVGDVPIGYASNEFGAIGIWVVNNWQRKGLGTYLSKKFMDLNPRLNQIGQMTDAGKNLAKSVHRSRVQDAVNAGEQVPPEVLADYPELKPEDKMATYVNILKIGNLSLLNAIFQRAVYNRPN